MDIAERVKAHADAVLRAAGSGLCNYTMPSSRRAILSAMMDAYEEAYRAGADKVATIIGDAKGQPHD